MAHHEKFKEVLFQASPCLGLLHFLLLFSYLLAKVADPEQSNSLWLTDRLTGEKGTLHLSFSFLQPLPSSYPSCPSRWDVTAAHCCALTQMQQDPSVSPVSTSSAGKHCFEHLCKLGRWSVSVVNYPLCSSGSSREWVAVLWQPADNALVSWLKSGMKQGWHGYPTLWTRAEMSRCLSVLLPLIIFKGDGETYLIGK